MITATFITDYLQTQSDLINQELDRLLPSTPGPHQELFEAARYALLGGGKRLRPILALATSRTLKGNEQVVLTPACSLELIHTYSMIHDDLPCMDNDDYRRGKLTVHKKYSEGHAVLTGDFLLTYAFEVLAKAPHIDESTKVELIALLARQSGATGMIGGQAMDLSSEGKTISLETLRFLHRNKTGALLTASIEFGAILSHAKGEHLRCLREFGEAIGLCFQVVDDILDVTSSEKKHGRAVASDVYNDKSTYVSLLGIEAAQGYARECYEQAVSALKPLPYDTSLLVGIADFMVGRTY